MSGVRNAQAWFSALLINLSKTAGDSSKGGLIILVWEKPYLFRIREKGTIKHIGKIGEILITARKMLLNKVGDPVILSIFVWLDFYIFFMMNGILHVYDCHTFLQR